MSQDQPSERGGADQPAGPRREAPRGVGGPSQMGRPRYGKQGASEAGAPARAPKPDSRGGSGGRGRGPREDEAARAARMSDRTYDPRREERRKLTRVPLPDGVDPRDLDPEVRQDLRALSKETADLVAQHLVVAGRTMDEDPATALTHARAAGALAGRVGAVREAVGLVAYAAQEWAESLSELRAARRITGSAEHLAVMADCERALGRPERALAYAEDPVEKTLPPEVRVELALVIAGARRDMGQADAAVLLLQGPARATKPSRPWAARLWYAYADSLLDAGRTELAEEWFSKVLTVDRDGETDADERLLELQGVSMEYADDTDETDDQGADDADDEPREAVDLEALVAGIQGLHLQAPAPAAAPPVSSPEPEAAPEPAVHEAAVNDQQPFLAEPAPEPTGSEMPADPDVAAPSRPAPPAVAFLPAPADESENED